MKRLFDIVSATAVLLLFLPFFVVIALVVSIESSGRVFYFQTRVGKGNKDFKLFKFRTMITGSDKKGQITVGAKDSRITKVGYFLRKYKLDELPQLINIIKGDMSVVGPRPEVRKYVGLYTQEQMRVLSVRPGLTDYASLEYSNENEILGKVDNPDDYYIKTIMPHKLELNKKYIEDTNPLKDLKLIFNTIFKVAKS